MKSDDELKALFRQRLSKDNALATAEQRAADAARQKRAELVATARAEFTRFALEVKRLIDVLNSEEDMPPSLLSAHASPIDELDDDVAAPLFETVTVTLGESCWVAGINFEPETLRVEMKSNSSTQWRHWYFYEDREKPWSYSPTPDSTTKSLTSFDLGKYLVESAIKNEFCS